MGKLKELKQYNSILIHCSNKSVPLARFIFILEEFVLVEGANRAQLEGDPVRHQARITNQSWR